MGNPIYIYNHYGFALTFEHTYIHTLVASPPPALVRQTSHCGYWLLLYIY